MKCPVCGSKIYLRHLLERNLPLTRREEGASILALRGLGTLRGTGAALLVCARDESHTLNHEIRDGRIVQKANSDVPVVA